MSDQARLAEIERWRKESGLWTGSDHLWRNRFDATAAALREAERRAEEAEKQAVGRKMQMHEYRQENVFMKNERSRLERRLAEASRTISSLQAVITAEKRDGAALEEALLAASDDARLLIQDYYSGLPEHRAPVDAAVARLAHLFERDDEDCEPRTVDEIVTDGLAARAALASERETT